MGHEFNFGAWRDFAANDSDEILRDRILFSQADRFHPDREAITLLGVARCKHNVLDFGCGIGRNLVGMPREWTATGYDSEEMRRRLLPQCDREVVTDWDALRWRRYDAVLATLVFQHIGPVDLRQYLVDLRDMTGRLIVRSRANSDHGEDVLTVVREYWTERHLLPSHHDDHWLAVFEE